MKPRVGVTGPDRGGRAAWLMTSAAIRRAGGMPVRLSPLRPGDGTPVDALVLGGGADLAPELYEAPAREDEPVGPAHIVDRARDAFEGALLSESIERGDPVLGICRGAQLLNVAFGGTLYADIAALYVETPWVRTLFPKRRVHVASDSQLGRILHVESCYVNALHHQAIRSLGSGLRIVARDDAGVVQAIEREGSSGFCVGVQWHPEYMPQHRRQRDLFTALVRAAEARVLARSA